MKRSLGWAGTILLALVLLASRNGCDLGLPTGVKVGDYLPSPQLPNTDNGKPVQSTSTNGEPNFNYSAAPSTVIIGSFNIENFGPAKESRRFVMEHLVDIVHRFDLLAIQELSNKDQSVIKSFIQQINANGSRYNYIVGPRQGQSTSKEQYVYLFDTTKFKITSNPYVAPDPNRSMHRPPLVASFECLQAPPGQGFTFTLLNLHTDPDVVKQEFTALEKMMPTLFANHPQEDDFIILGDLNDSAKLIGRYRWLQNQMALVRASWPTTVAGNSLDNIVIDGSRTLEFRNQSGVLDMMLQYGLAPAQAKQISDHHPIWSVFSTVEAKNWTAETGAVTTR